MKAVKGLFGGKKARAKQDAISTGPTNLEGFEASVHHKTAAERALIDSACKDKNIFGYLGAAALTEIYDAMEPVSAAAGDVMMRQGEDGDQFFVIQTGRCGVYQAAEGEAGDGAQIVVHGSGKAFGEIALLFGSPRNATIKAEEACTLWCLDRHTYRCIVIGGSRKKKEQVETFVDKVPLLAKMSKADRGKVADALQLRVFQDGEAIMREGEEGDFFYIIEEGEVSVTEKGTEVARRGAGDYVGEQALLNNAPRIATVAAVGEVITLEMSRERFQRLFGGETEFRQYDAEQQQVDSEASDLSRRQRALTIDAKQSMFGASPGIADFTVMTTLGFGAYGRVQLVQHAATGKVCAMKILSKSHIIDRNQIEHVRNEVNVLAEMDHPFVVQMFCYFQDAANLYIIMEFVNGGELYSLLQNNGRLSNDWARQYASEVALAFENIHAQRVIYRDLKPGTLRVPLRVLLPLCLLCADVCCPCRRREPVD